MLGDVLASSVLFEAIKTEMPDSELHYLVNRGTEAVITHNPYIDKIISFDPALHKSVSSLLRFGKSLNHSNYDALIDIYGKLSSNLISLSINSPLKISKRKWYSRWLYTHTVEEIKTPQTNAGLALENRINLLGPINLEAPIIPRPKIYLSKSELKLAKDKVSQAIPTNNRPIFMIALLGSSASKSYPPLYMASLIEFIVAKTNANLVLNYMPDQEEEARQIIGLVPESSRKNILNDLYAKGLRDFLALTSRCDALIGNEGGATNMAKALNVSTFTIFSPWINKMAWNMFEDGQKHVSVHLEDFLPELYQKADYKQMKNQALSLYEKFSFDYLKSPLAKFLDQF